jgi:peptide/nickel transport system permease protein
MSSRKRVPSVDRRPTATKRHARRLMSYLHSLRLGNGVRLGTRQLAQLALVLLVASFIIFACVYLTPGSPEQVLFGNRKVSEAARAAVRAQYHLDDPLLARYWYWLTGALHGDFGTSLAYREPVSVRISAAAPTSALLIAYASLLIVVLGVLLGALTALRPGKLDGFVLLVTNIGVAIPTFVASTLLISIFAVRLGWFPVFGAGDGLADQLWHLTLPAVALAIWAVALLTRVTRSAMREELRQEHVETARARGLAPRRVVRRHVLRNALIPISTVVGLQTAGLISGAVIVEQAFNLNGLGQLLITAVGQNDFATVQAVALLLVAAFVVVNAVIDLLYLVLDPRVRAQHAAR